MKEIQEFTVAQLRNEEAFYFFEEVQTNALEFLNREGDGPMVDAFIAALSAFDEVLKMSRKNTFSDQVQKAVSETDTNWRGLRKQAKSMITFPDAAKSALAKKIFETIEKYGDVTRLSHGEKYGGIDNLVQDILQIPEEELKTVGVDLWLFELSQAAVRFRSAYGSFINEEASKVKGITQQRRSKAEETYKYLVKRVNAIELVYADNRHEEFIKNLNVLINKEKAKLASRQTRSENKKDEEENTPIAKDVTASK